MNALSNWNPFFLKVDMRKSVAITIIVVIAVFFFFLNENSEIKENTSGYEKNEKQNVLQQIPDKPIKFEGKKITVLIIDSVTGFPIDNCDYTFKTSLDGVTKEIDYSLEAGGTIIIDSIHPEEEYVVNVSHDYYLSYNETFAYKDGLKKVIKMTPVGVLKVQVKNGNDGLRISNATVEINSYLNEEQKKIDLFQAAKTDEDGNCIFYDLPIEKTYTVTTKKENLIKNVTKGLEIFSGEQEIEIELFDGGCIKGNLISSVESKFFIRILSYGEEELLNDGNSFRSVEEEVFSSLPRPMPFSFCGLRSGAKVVLISSGNSGSLFFFYRLVKKLSERETYDLGDILDTAGSKVKLITVGDDGERIPHSKIEIGRTSESQFHDAPLIDLVSDENGEFVVHGMNGSRIVKIIPPENSGKKLYSSSRRISFDKDEIQEFVLKTMGEVTVDLIGIPQETKKVEWKLFNTEGFCTYTATSKEITHSISLRESLGKTLFVHGGGFYGEIELTQRNTSRTVYLECQVGCYLAGKALPSSPETTSYVSVFRAGDFAGGNTQPTCSPILYTRIEGDGSFLIEGIPLSQKFVITTTVGNEYPMVWKEIETPDSSEIIDISTK